MPSSLQKLFAPLKKKLIMNAMPSSLQKLFAPLKKKWANSDYVPLSQSNAAITPRGHVPICLKEDQEGKYMVPVEFLSSPSFRELLNQTNEDYELEQRVDGPVILSCTRQNLEEVLKELKNRKKDE